MMETSLVGENPPQADVSLGDLARLRQGCYRFFGASFLYPEGERLGNMVDAAGDLLKPCESFGGVPYLDPWQRMLAALQELAEGNAARVEGEYVRLFLVRPAAPPFESFYLDPKRQATGWIVARLSQEYSRKGVIPSPAQRQPPDHVSVELEFMAFLCSLEAEAWEREVSADGVEILESQRDFLGQHLGRWFSAFSQQVAGADRVGLYALIAETAGAFISHDRDLIALLLTRFQAAEADS